MKFYMIALKDLSAYLLLKLCHCTIYILVKSGLDDLLGCGAQALRLGTLFFVPAIGLEYQVSLRHRNALVRLGHLWPCLWQ